MEEETEQTDEIETIVENLYNHILLGVAAKDALLSGCLNPNTPYGLDQEGYTWNRRLAELVFGTPQLAGVWSEGGIRDRMRDLLVNLATAKGQVLPGTEPQISFLEAAERFWSQVNTAFPPAQVYVPVSGLVLAQPLDLGDVQCLPLETAKRDLGVIPFPAFLDGLDPRAHSIATGQVTAELQKAAVFLRERVDVRLSVLRYISTLVHRDGSPTPIYVLGREPKQIGHTLARDTSGGACMLTNSIQTLAPLVMNAENLATANQYGLKHLQALLKAGKREPLEEDLLTAIRWFGDASQDLSITSSFVKFYIAIETITKKEKERARTVLPDRIGDLLEPFHEAKRQQMIEYMHKLVTWRNEVFHAGSPTNESIEHLALTARLLSRKTINEVRLHIERDGVRTKDQLIDWIKRGPRQARSQ